MTISNIGKRVERWVPLHTIHTLVKDNLITRAKSLNNVHPADPGILFQEFILRK